MASSGPPPSGTTAADGSEPQLPPYQPPSAPLTSEALQALQRLQDKDLAMFTEGLKLTKKDLGSSAFEIMETLANHQTLANQQAFVAKRLEKWVKAHASIKAGIPIVGEPATGTLESRVRRTMDSQTRQKILKELSEDAMSSTGTVSIASTRCTLSASQFQPRSERDDEDEDTDEPVMSSGPGLTVLIRDTIDQPEEECQEIPFAQIIAELDGSVAIRRPFHDGRYLHVDPQPLIPAARIWIDEDGLVTTTTTTTTTTTSKMVQKHYLTYNEVHNLCKRSASKIISEFRPNLMIAIGEGGYIPARILHSFLRQPGHPNIPMQVIGFSLYEDLDRNDGPEEIPGTKVTRTQWLDLSSLEMTNFVGKNILIVDGVDDTRMTLEYAVRELEKDVAEVTRNQGKEGEETNFFIFVMHNKDKEKKGVLPGDMIKRGRYLAAETVPDGWICYPWEAENIEEHDRLAGEMRNGSTNGFA